MFWLSIKQPPPGSWIMPGPLQESTSNAVLWDLVNLLGNEIFPMGARAAQLLLQRVSALPSEMATPGQSGSITAAFFCVGSISGVVLVVPRFVGGNEWAPKGGSRG